uniref:Uncharacterized protein n=1 Tax=Sphaerodactylus townsendi TaxID=933632 RepID=A0ACB8EZN3_9SAUR
MTGADVDLERFSGMRITASPNCSPLTSRYCDCPPMWNLLVPSSRWSGWMFSLPLEPKSRTTSSIIRRLMNTPTLISTQAIGEENKTSHRPTEKHELFAKVGKLSCLSDFQDDMFFTGDNPIFLT